MSPEDREEVALSLLDSLSEHVDQTQVDAAWSAEITRRVDEIRGGTVKMMTRDEVDAFLDERRATRNR